MMKVKECYINITNLRFHAYHGVLPQERLTGNDYLLTLHICYDFSEALISDDVRHTLNYAEVYQIVSEEMKHSCNLLEKVAGNIGNHLIQAFPLIQAIDLQITKVNPPMGADCKGAGVEVHLINDKSGV